MSSSNLGGKESAPQISEGLHQPGWLPHPLATLHPQPFSYTGSCRGFCFHSEPTCLLWAPTRAPGCPQLPPMLFFHRMSKAEVGEQWCLVGSLTICSPHMWVFRWTEKCLQRSRKGKIVETGSWVHGVYDVFSAFLYVFENFHKKCFLKSHV